MAALLKTACSCRDVREREVAMRIALIAALIAAFFISIQPLSAQSGSMLPPLSAKEIELHVIRADEPRLTLECGFVSERRPDGKPGRACAYRLKGIEGLSDEQAIARCRPLAESLYAHAVADTIRGSLQALSPSERLGIDESCTWFVRVARLGPAMR